MTATAKNNLARHKTCSVCGAGAGRWQQHWNRDTGYGICRDCADFMSDPVKRGHHAIDPLEMENLYGRAGVHYEPKLYRLHGRDFAIAAEYPDSPEGTAAANAFMVAHGDTGLLAAADGRLIIATLTDKGCPVDVPRDKAETSQGRSEDSAGTVSG